MPLVRHRFFAFGGATCEIVAVGVDDRLVSASVADVYAFEARLSRFAADSELSRFNHSAGRRVAVSPLLEALLRAALEAYGWSEGLVNGAVLPALLAAGYDRSIEAVRRRPGPQGTPVPAPPLPEVLEVGRGWARMRVGTAIDLGGVGKGWLADALAERFDDAVVNLGGDVRTTGRGPHGRPWCIGVADGTAVLVGDAGIATSGTAGRRWSTGHHLVDPRSGRCADTDVACLSVVAEGALRAEVLAKAGAILGSAAASSWVGEHGARVVALVRGEAPVGGDGPLPGPAAVVADGVVAGRELG